MDETPGQAFQQATQYHRDTLAGHSLDWAAMPPTYELHGEVPLHTLAPPEPEDDRANAGKGHVLEESTNHVLGDRLQFA